MRILSRPTTAVALALVMFVVSGCIPDGLAFRQDHRLSIGTPDGRSEISTPFEVSWLLEEPRSDEQRFAVLVDRFPPRPGQSIETLLPAELREPSRCDVVCRTVALESRNVFVTDLTSLTITRLPIRRGVSDEQQRRHEISVIVLDDGLRRVGESVAWIEIDTAEGAP